ncbi:MAG TPA: gamma-glutamyl-gamma-aminobutyrate hydrolase family protein [Pyrinomonadaceae bacterium]|nr:gamma-glutamyl-gamma-aminobutyrate hydrolase family protein [Pyrinomonadaceae bacterium]
MIYLVDNTIDGQGLSPREIRDALERLRPGVPIVVERYTNVSLRRVHELSPSHIILSGQSHPWSLYTPDALAGVFEVIHEAAQPILGICGGHQQIALSYGSTLGIMNRVAPGEGYEGALKLRGFYDVETNGEAIFANLPSRVTVWQSHYEEVRELPRGFEITASSETCRIEAMKHNARPLFSVQFHPELFDEEHPQGRSILENFLNL